MATVLIVDDSKYLRLMISKILKKQGHTIVAEAETGLEAIEKYKQFMPSVVTMDIVMPKMNGLLAMKEIMAVNPKANIVVVTALGHEPLVRQALKIGAKDFVIKPFKVDQLVSAVENTLV
jgi:two-component system chemotaxis response regulator CheY